MINIKNLKVRFYNHVILDDISICLPDRGFVVILGDSGSGKTTLIKALNDEINYEGQIHFDGVNIKTLNAKDKQVYRLSNIGNVFQHFGLYDNLTVFDNIALMKSTNNISDKEKINKILKKLEIYKLRDQLVKNLSGGEKQRVAIARGIINNPKCIFADEPTGSLDEYNSIEIVKILKQISINSLVIMVTHNVDLIKQYADKIICLKDGKITKNIKLNNVNHPGRSNVHKNKNSRHFLSPRFLFKYTLTKFKEHKIRTGTNISIMSLSLLSLGLTFSISNIIFSSVKNTYSILIEDNRIIVSPKEDNSYYEKEASELEEVVNIASSYHEYISNYGAMYNGDYQRIFEGRNVAKYSYNQISSYIPGLSFKQIAEYKWIEDIDSKIFPNVSALNNDEIVLGLSLNHIKSICEDLNIKQSIESLGSFIENHNLFCVFEFANYDWEYEDQQIFTIKGIILDSSINIYHSNHLWNKEIIENRMRIPTKGNFSNISVAPWTLNKVYYVKLKGDNATFLDYINNEMTLDPFLFEICGESYRSNTIRDTSKIKEILVFNRINNSIIPRYDTYIQKELKKLSSPIYCTDSGYACYSSILMSGFSCPMYFSSDESLLIEMADLYSDSMSKGEQYFIADKIIEGHFSKRKNSNMGFQCIKEKDLSYDEIYISSAVKEKLFKNDDIKNKRLYISYLPKGSDECIFISLNIKGVISNSHYLIYHNSSWTLTFFQSKLGVSIFDLSLRGISYEVGNSFDYEEAKKALNKAFPKLELIAPLQDVESSLNDVVFYVTLVLLIITILSSVMSILITLLTTSIYTHEIAKDMSIASSLGFSKKEIKKFCYTQSALLITISLLISFVLLVVTSIIIASNGFMNMNVIEALNPLSFLFMSAFALIIYLIMTLRSKYLKQ